MQGIVLMMRFVTWRSVRNPLLAVLEAQIVTIQQKFALMVDAKQNQIAAKMSAKRTKNNVQEANYKYVANFHQAVSLGE
jgi:Tfp pilus assembly protein PilV